MCMLCNQERAQSFAASKDSDGTPVYSLSIAPEGLIDNSNAAYTERATATDRELDYYLHTPGGAVTVAGGGFGEQTIESVAISAADQDYFRSVVERLDAVIDLGGGGNTLGLATTSARGGWELFVNYPEVQFDENYRRYVLIHELGHALGLEHPFEAGDGDTVNGTIDPWASAFPEDTVMAYRNPRGDNWPEFFTDNDFNALIQLWGREGGSDASTQLLVASGGMEVSALMSQWLGFEKGSLQVQEGGERTIEVRASSWTSTLAVNRIARAGAGGNDLQAQQLDSRGQRSE